MTARALDYDPPTGNYKIFYCEAQGKGRQRVDLGRSLKGHLWMVDILSLMLYIKVGCHHPPTGRLILLN